MASLAAPRLRLVRPPVPLRGAPSGNKGTSGGQRSCGCAGEQAVLTQAKLLDVTIAELKRYTHN
jgi:hypothetical protein